MHELVRKSQRKTSDTEERGISYTYLTIAVAKELRDTHNYRYKENTRRRRTNEQDTGDKRKREA